MNEDQGQEVLPKKETNNSEIVLLDCLIALAKRKKLVIGLPFVSAILTAAISFAIPNVYSASTKLMPPQQSQSGAAALLSQLGGVAGVVAGGGGMKTPNDLYVSMLKSQTVADKLIAKFNLKQVYQTDSHEEATRILAQNTSIASGKDGLIMIGVEDEDKKLVARLANAYVSELFDLTKDLAITDAAKRRVFYERQFEMAKNNLAEAEVALKSGLNSSGLLSVDSESRVVVETIGRLRAQVTAKEIQLNSMSAFVTANNPEYKKVQEELSSLKAELSKMENGAGKDALGDPKPNGNPASLENAKLLRNVKYQQMLYELLAKQYEIARMDEAKDPPIIQVLDPANEPERKSKPKRAFIVIIVFFMSLVLAIGWTLARDILFANQNPGDAEKWSLFKRLLRGD